MVQGEVTMLDEAAAFRRSTSEWVSNCVVVREKDRTTTVYQDVWGLNALLKNNSRGLVDLPGIFDDIVGAGWHTSIDLASGSTQLEIAEEDKYKTEFREAYGEMREFNRCGLGLKSLPSAFSAHVGG